MRPEKLPDGRIRVPTTVEIDDEVIDAVRTIGPDHPDYARTLAQIDRADEPDRPAQGTTPP